MGTTDPRLKVDALLGLAAGKSQRATAAEVGVHPGTIARWRRDPQFARELVGLKQLLATRPPAGVLLEAVEAAAVRLAPPGPQTGADGRVRVMVEIPAGASPRRRRQLIGRAVARVLEGGS